MKIISNKKTIFCDFDGVIANTIKSIVTLYNQDFKYYKDFKPIHWTEINTWDFTECDCANKDYINTYFNQRRFFDNLEFMENAKEMLDKLKDYYDIKIVSMGFSPNLIGKNIWLQSNISYAEFIGVNFKEHEDKSHINMKGNILIDDSANNLETSNADIKICYGDKYTWNENWEGKRCWNWTEIFNYLVGIYKK